MIPNINKLSTVKALVSIYKVQVGIDMAINLWSDHFFSSTVFINQRSFLEQAPIISTMHREKESLDTLGYR